eukprot:1392742-Prymnesium_polylepis.1
MLFAVVHALLTSSVQMTLVQLGSSRHCCRACAWVNPVEIGVSRSEELVAMEVVQMVEMLGAARVGLTE